MGQDLGALPSAERAKRYREFANDAIQKANAATDPGRRAEYLTMATGWHALAVEAEQVKQALSARETTASDAESERPFGD